MEKLFDFLEKYSKIIFALNLLVFVYWVVANSIDVYRYAFIGAVFELLWAPLLILFFALPILNLLMLIKNKFNLKKLWLYAFLINCLTVVYLYLQFGW